MSLKASPRVSFWLELLAADGPDGLAAKRGAESGLVHARLSMPHRSTANEPTRADRPSGAQGWYSSSVLSLGGRRRSVWGFRSAPPARSPLPVHSMRGSRTTSAVSLDRSAALASLKADEPRSTYRFQRRARSSPTAARAITLRDPSEEFDGRLGVGLQVQPPRRFGLSPAVHRRRDQVRAVLDVADDRDASLARVAPDRSEPEHPPLAARRGPQADPSAGDPEYRARCRIQIVRTSQRGTFGGAFSVVSDSRRSSRLSSIYGVNYAVNIALHRRLVKVAGHASSPPTFEVTDRRGDPAERDRGASDAPDQGPRAPGRRGPRRSRRQSRR